MERYQQAKKGPRLKRRVDPVVKHWVWAIREREAGCCGQKVAYFLEREHGVHLSVPKIYEILREKYVIHSKWKKNRRRRGPVSVASAPRQVVQMDTVMFRRRVCLHRHRHLHQGGGHPAGAGADGRLRVCLPGTGYGTALRCLGGVDPNGRGQ